MYQMYKLFKDVDKLDTSDIEDQSLLETIFSSLVNKNDSNCCLKKDANGIIVAKYYLNLITCDEQNTTYQEKFLMKFENDIKAFFPNDKDIYNDGRYYPLTEIYYLNLIELLNDIHQKIAGSNTLSMIYNKLLEKIKNHLLSFQKRSLYKLNHYDCLKKINNTHFHLDTITKEKLAMQIKQKIVDFIKEASLNQKNFSIQDLTKNENDANKQIESKNSYKDTWYENINNAPEEEYPVENHALLKETQCTNTSNNIMREIQIYLNNNPSENMLLKVFSINEFKKEYNIKELANNIKDIHYLNKLIYINQFIDALNKIHNQKKESELCEKGWLSSTTIAINNAGIDCKWLADNDIYLTKIKNKHINALFASIATDLALPKDNLRALISTRLEYYKNTILDLYYTNKKNSRSRLEDIAEKILQNNSNQRQNQIAIANKPSFFGIAMNTVAGIFTLPEDLKRF
jgi:hypothetical protein